MDKAVAPLRPAGDRGGAAGPLRTARIIPEKYTFEILGTEDVRAGQLP